MKFRNLSPGDHFWWGSAALIGNSFYEKIDSVSYLRVITDTDGSVYRNVFKLRHGESDLEITLISKATATQDFNLRELCAKL